MDLIFNSAILTCDGCNGTSSNGGNVLEFSLCISFSTSMLFLIALALKCRICIGQLVL